MPKHKGFNPRQQKYKANRIAGMTQYNAARAAGYSENYARMACKIEQVVKHSLADHFERAGLTDKKIVEHALAGLEATRPYGREGKIAPDWRARRAYLEMILRLTGKLKDSPLIDASQHQHYTNVLQQIREVLEEDANLTPVPPADTQQGATLGSLLSLQPKS